eukprot:CAMPEP_0202029630 /NCGR_PEP_ID=MMETSP0905-20130828/64080_1 /ASSEMBLY_ACC=CAM_ASM_000554 /TAXON_ID=420261 /ORGANISM="Thalassiosira antarctica, Strain CCMP982" /LENGTH=125 /DNA_ID=CAMNT_0048593401 /DNA_START=1199 /DNA_END=1577 /DNA_ORIENTATION=-
MDIHTELVSMSIHDLIEFYEHEIPYPDGRNEKGSFLVANLYTKIVLGNIKLKKDDNDGNLADYYTQIDRRLLGAVSPVFEVCCNKTKQSYSGLNFLIEFYEHEIPYPDGRNEKGSFLVANLYTKM